MLMAQIHDCLCFKVLSISALIYYCQVNASSPSKPGIMPEGEMIQHHRTLVHLCVMNLV